MNERTYEAAYEVVYGAKKSQSLAHQNEFVDYIYDCLRFQNTISGYHGRFSVDRIYHAYNAFSAQEPKEGETLLVYSAKKGFRALVGKPLNIKGGGKNPVIQITRQGEYVTLLFWIRNRWVTVVECPLHIIKFDGNLIDKSK
jgi:hypothetical protein